MTAECHSPFTCSLVCIGSTYIDSAKDRQNTDTVSALETVNLDRRLRDALLDEERGDLLALVALELDDLPHLRVLDERAVARELLRAP
jgi:hypothetical protein